MSEIPTYPDEQSIEQRIAAAEARGFAAGLERAALELRWRSCTCGIRIRALIPVATAPARLDTDKTAQPLTEIRAVVPAGKRIVQPYGVEQYVYQETGATAPKLFDGNVHVTPGSTAVATPPRSEDQVRAEERERCARECDAERGSAAARNDGVGGQVAEWCAKHIRALGHAPVDDTAALRAKEQRDQLATSEAFWIEMLDRARCGCFQRDCRVHGAYAAEDVARVEKARGALAKSEEVQAADLQAEMARPLSYAELDKEHRRMCERMRAAEARVRVLEGALGPFAEHADAIDHRDGGLALWTDDHPNPVHTLTVGHFRSARAALAKPLKHEDNCPCSKGGTLGAAFPHAYCQCAALAKKSEGT